MLRYVAIGSGGVLGTLLRYGIALLVPAMAGVIAVALINIAGAFVLGFLHHRQVALYRHPVLYLGITTGFIGSFTTFSTLCQLVNTGLAQHAPADVLLSGFGIIVGLGAAALGGGLSRSLQSAPALDAQETSV